jgi:hypothetical protein
MEMNGKLEHTSNLALVLGNNMPTGKNWENIKMKKIENLERKMILRILTNLFVAFLFVLLMSCKRDVDLLKPASNPAFAEVFEDDFVAGLDYSAFGDSKLDAFEIDNTTAFKGTSSIKIAVPDLDDPAEWTWKYAGGALYSKFPRDLSSYNALTFWAKANRAATAEVGFGNDNSGTSTYTASIQEVNFGKSWTKYAIPIPSADRLTAETGMFWFAADPDKDGDGYTLWFDEIRFEKLGTIAHPAAKFETAAIAGMVGSSIDIADKVGSLAVVYNVSGGDLTVSASPAYLNFIPDNDSVITVEDGMFNVIGLGSTVVSGVLGKSDTAGTIIVNGFLPPVSPAPTPTVHPDSVIALFSDAYANVSVNTWNPFWQWSTARVQDADINGDNVKIYSNLNFVGIEFTSPTINASQMTHFHMDIYTPDMTTTGEFTLKLVDFGADGSYDGGDDSEVELIIRNDELTANAWIGLDISLSGLAGKTNMAQLVLAGNDNINTVFVDNLYFYNNGEEAPPTGNAPSEPAPIPTYGSSDVISLFSNSYTDVTVDTWNPHWQYSTAEVADLQIYGDDVKKYTKLNFVGIEFTSQTIDATAMTHFYMNVWTPDDVNAPSVFKIKLVDFGANGVWDGGGDDVEHELTLNNSTSPAMASGAWVTLDIPLSSFSGMTTRGHIAQLVLSGDPNTVYVDNILFHK